MKKFISAISLTIFLLMLTVVTAGAAVVVDGVTYDTKHDDTGATVFFVKEVDQDLVGEVKLDEKTVGIYANAFDGCDMITKIILPERLETIGDYAFAGANIESIEIPSRVTAIGEGIFTECTSLREISLPEGITSIGDMAFAYCEELQKISLPSGLTSIGELAFAYCESLTELSIPESVTDIGDNAFSCTAIKDITIPPGVTNMGICLFQECNSLTSATVYANSISIGTFYDCPALTDVFIMKNLKNISEGAFSNTNISNVYYEGTKEEFDAVTVDNSGELNNDGFIGAAKYYNYPDSYTIENISVQSAAGETLSEPPVNEAFIIKADVSENTSENAEEYLFAALYDKGGALLGIYEAKPDNAEFKIPAQTAEIGAAEVFVWRSLAQMRPLAESKSIEW